MKKIIILTISIMSIIVLFACGNEDGGANNTTTESYNLEEGQEMPNVVVETNSGDTFDLSKTSKPVLINFWATWCPPCKAEMPGIQNLYNEYKDKIDFILINLSESKEAVNRFIKENNYTFPIGYDEKDKYGMMFNVMVIPTTYIVDSNKKISAYIIGGTDENTFRDYLEKVINE